MITELLCESKMKSDLVVIPAEKRYAFVNIGYLRDEKQIMASNFVG